MQGSNYALHLLRRRCFAPDGFDAVSVQNVGSTYIIVFETCQLTVLQSCPQALHSSWNVVLGVISAAASLPSCPRNRKKRSKQRAEYLQKQDDILSQQNKAKARARYKADPEKKKASVRDSTRPIPKRRPQYATATRPIPKRRRPVCDSYKSDPEKKASVREAQVDPEKGSVRDS
ncbi:hypothetical protein EMCRGX_G002692 [Ephydatia muelleri]